VKLSNKEKFRQSFVAPVYRAYQNYSTGAVVALLIAISGLCLSAMLRCFEDKQPLTSGFR
jgi:hypothetical protein